LDELRPLLSVHGSAGTWRGYIVTDPSERSDAVASRIAEHLALARLIGREPVFTATVTRIPSVARATSPVLILGETGTGKELCARAVHHLSARRQAPFIPVDCGTLPDHLCENELFGHVRGAYTDAHCHQRGLVAMAEGGTLFLDEVDSLTLSAQAKLLRLLQEGTYKPLGADRFSRADVRIIAATNLNLRQLVEVKTFRPDLYFRLNVLRLVMPPLRARRGDIPLLAEHFVRVLCDEAGMPRKTLAAAAIERLAAADWPGNVRELFNVLQRAVVFAEGAMTIALQHLALSDDQRDAEPSDTEGMRAASREDDQPPDAGEGGFREARARAVEAFERTYVENLLRKHNGNVTRSAREAKKDRRAFGRLIKRYRIDRETG
jgi:transcriptional regulator with GAF, ATPase, and Fis domain